MEQLLIFPDVYVTVLAAVVGTMLVACGMVLAALSFLDTPRGQRMVRDHLGRQLASTRMWSMLEHRKISPLAYVDGTSTLSLRTQVKTCRTCAKQELCDGTLGYVGWRQRNYGFCPNRRLMDRFVRTDAHSALR